MKIAVSATGKNKESLIDRRFGRCDFFQIFNTDTGVIEAVENKGASSGGGAGIAAASQVIDAGAAIVITGNLGPNAYELIEKAGIKAYSSEIVPVFKAIEFYQKNQLSKITTAGKSHQGMN